MGDFVCERASSALLCVALGARGEHGSVSKDGSVIFVTAVVCYVYLILGDITLFYFKAAMKFFVNKLA